MLTESALLSRREFLKLGAVAVAAFVTPLGCDKPAALPRHKGASNAAASRIGTAVPDAASSAPLTPPCTSGEVSLGTEVPFNPQDRAFGADRRDFEPKRAPRPGDWMARYHETGLSFDEYVASRPTQRQGRRNILVLQPLGNFGKANRNQLLELAAFTEAFFDSTVRLAPQAALPKAGQRVRHGTNGTWVQHHTRRILKWLSDSALAPDAVCVLGITMEDLYPEPSWNYVFGEATLEKRVGVYSLARYQSKFWGEPDTSKSRALARLRSFKVLAHEAAHVFSLQHCRRYECLMNGSNSLDEMDRSPIEPCPVCLKMLQYNLRFDIRARYRRLMAIYDRNGLVAQRDWVEARLLRIGCG